MDIFEKIIRENCWKFDKGYPDSQEDINYLISLVEQQLNLFSEEELAAMLSMFRMNEDIKKRKRAIRDTEKFHQNNKTIQIGNTKILNKI